MKKPPIWINVPINVNYNTIKVRPMKYTPDPWILSFFVRNFIIPDMPIKKYKPRKNKIYLI